MKEIFAIINQKGGVGKTTTAYALGAGISTKGFKVILLDLDAQGNLSHSLGSAPGSSVTIMDVLVKELSMKDAVIRGEKLAFIPSSPALAGADMVISQTGKEYRLKEAMTPILEEYDYIVIDTPPALGILTVNALTACTKVIIPAQADIYSLQGIGQLYGTIEAVKRYCNPCLKIMGILLTRYTSRSILTRDIKGMIEQTAERLETIVYKTAIREAVAIKEAQAQQTDIYSYAPKGKATDDYRMFVEEVLAQ